MKTRGSSRRSKMMLVDAAPNVVVLRKALDSDMQGRRAANESLLLMSEAADRLRRGNKACRARAT